ncbi:uncharacterized protein LOC124709045 [Schistocerca piceifrons]|uniref:uncharacterized protein LOC124709045 n=1 Tax=Schistocerca piceifrons TaxID=274613 RepID=UPI001F5FA557|nr:uncharacterized protein LOC124709045 [Schistocerca piceifrons]
MGLKHTLHLEECIRDSSERRSVCAVRRTQHAEGSRHSSSSLSSASGDPEAKDAGRLAASGCGWLRLRSAQADAATMRPRALASLIAVVSLAACLTAPSQTSAMHSSRPGGGGGGRRSQRSRDHHAL